MGDIRIEQKGDRFDIIISSDDAPKKATISAPKQPVARRKKLTFAQRAVRFCHKYQLYMASGITLVALVIGAVIAFCKIGDNIAEERIYDYGREKQYAEYTVQAGDDLYGIAQKMSGTMPEYASVNAYLKDLRAANDMSKYEEKIVVGQTIRIPYFTETNTQRQILGTYATKALQ